MRGIRLSKRQKEEAAAAAAGSKEADFTSTSGSSDTSPPPPTTTMQQAQQRRPLRFFRKGKKNNAVPQQQQHQQATVIEQPPATPIPAPGVTIKSFATTAAPPEERPRGWNFLSPKKKRSSADSSSHEQPNVTPSNSTSSSHNFLGRRLGWGQSHGSSSTTNNNKSATAELPQQNSSSTKLAANGNASTRKDLFRWQDEMEEQEISAVIQQKQAVKERDGFCRRVDTYDGQVITVEARPAYELGQYLGGGVAGVVYEGHRLQPAEEYPVRVGQVHQAPNNNTANVSESSILAGDDGVTVSSFLCGTAAAEKNVVDTTVVTPMADRDSSMLTMDSLLETSGGPTVQREEVLTAEIALETTRSNANVVIIDQVDAPSRSKHAAKAAMEQSMCEDASMIGGGMGETVAIKILNPVGFRTLSPSVTATAVVARPGDSLEAAVVEGDRPMEERHVWWLINPSSRNLRTLQRYNNHNNPNVSVDRGSAEKGLRISLVAAYRDARTGQLNELPLTRCIEIWGHVPFGATDTEFAEIMGAVDRVNQGMAPQPVPAFINFDDNNVPGRVGTADSSYDGSNGLSELRISQPMHTKRTGIYRAAYTDRKTVFCEELNAYIAIPAAPSKYLKWLRQRRAATKEIRNMMLIGRHRNVVHLFEVLELIQENKSTMFLILELVRGGELFDLISSNAAKISSKDKIPEGFSESETVMRKFFRELASGVHYCHSNGIAHRDLKPENLLVHNSRSGDCVLKIADFGLSAAFGPNSASQADQDTVVESLISGAPPHTTGTTSTASGGPSPMKQHVERIINASGNALAFLTCGVVDEYICNPRGTMVDGGPVPLKRMTSVVGSPHYVAPEIISQSDNNKRRKTNKNKEDGEEIKGYDGTKADVWSAGVILYAMLFRSLPFGEDLLRCPRFQSYRKWYDDVKRGGKNRRNHIMGALNPVITDAEEKDFLGPHWFFPSNSSRESRDLIVYMLNPDPDMRPTIQLVLQHPWLLKKA